MKLLQFKLIFSLSLMLFLVVSCNTQQNTDNHKKETTPDEQTSKAINPDISDEAAKLLDFLYQIKGKYTLSGHHNSPREPEKYNMAVKQITEKYPVVWGNDFSFRFHGKDPDTVRQNMINAAIEMHKKGHIITLMWHSCYPTNGDSCHGKTIWIWDDVIPQQEWNELITPGTELNNQWKKQADNVAKYLKQLQKAKVPVLWRPYHEMNGIWFWWCQHPGENGYVKLWRLMYNYFTNHHNLNNLIWVWNPNAPRDKKGDEAYAYKDYFPGIDYVDVLAADVYHNDYRQSHHDQLLELAQGKPIAFGEVGRMPDPAVLEKQPQWTWFMGWANWLHKANKPDSVKLLYNSPSVISLDEIFLNEEATYEIKID